jgi:hypothetical protein
MLRFNPLPLAGCFVVEADRSTILALSTWPSVAVVRANPIAGTN